VQGYVPCSGVVITIEGSTSGMIEIIQLAEFPSYFPVDEPYPRLPPLSILFYIYSKGKGLVVPSGVVRTGQITDILVRDSKGPESGSSFMLLLCAREGIFLHGLAVLATGARAPWSSWFPRSKNGTWGTRHYQPGSDPLATICCGLLPFTSETKRGEVVSP